MIPYGIHVMTAKAADSGGAATVSRKDALLR
jgi:hypothetical protein